MATLGQVNLRVQAAPAMDDQVVEELRATGIEVEAQLWEGSAGDGLLWAAERLGADLIVVGRPPPPASRRLERA